MYGTTRIAYGLNPSTFKFELTGFTDDILMDALERYSSITFGYGLGNANSNGIVLPGIRVHVLSSNDTLFLGVNESYSIVAPDPAANGWATLAATTVFGALRGLETFSQLVQFNFTSSTYFMAFANITDYPRFPFRAVMIDTARHFLTIPSMLEVLDAMSYLKLNTLHVHLSDDDSFSFFVPAYPRLSATGCYSNVSHTHSPSDLASLVAYARLRGIRVIPEFDTPAHFSTLISAYPE